MENRKSSSDKKKNIKEDTSSSASTSQSKEEDNLPYNPNITEHDKDMLAQNNIHGDGGDDQQLRDRKDKVDFAGEDLDIPGRNQAKKSNTGYRDEENQLFSQGGEDNEKLEQDETL